MDAANKNDDGNCNRPMTQWIIPDWGYYHTAQERLMKIDISPLFSSQKWIETNNLGSTDDEQTWKKCKKQLMTSFFMIFNSLQGVSAWNTVIFAPITDTYGLCISQLRWVGEAVHLSRCPIWRSTINKAEQAHTHTHTKKHSICQRPSSMANYSQNVKVHLCFMVVMEKRVYVCVQG